VCVLCGGRRERLDAGIGINTPRIIISVTTKGVHAVRYLLFVFVLKSKKRKQKKDTFNAFEKRTERIFTFPRMYVVSSNCPTRHVFFLS
jgi:hypothetical protein